jgi:hypothetical protein
MVRMLRQRPAVRGTVPFRGTCGPVAGHERAAAIGCPPRSGSPPSPDPKDLTMQPSPPDPGSGTPQGTQPPPGAFSPPPHWGPGAAPPGTVPPGPWGPSPYGWGPPGFPPPRQARSRKAVVAIVAACVLGVAVLGLAIVGAVRVGRNAAEAMNSSSIAAASTAAAHTSAPVAPAGLGSDPELDDYAARCYTGEMQACDDLYDMSDPMSRYEQYGMTCGGRVKSFEVDYCTDLD